jgi:phage gpG-like protein
MAKFSNAYYDQLKVMSDLKQELGVVLQRIIRNHIKFEGKGSPITWTKSIRASMTGTNTLYDTGNMYRHIKWLPKRNGVKVGNSLKRALAHEVGYTIKKAEKTLRYTVGDTWYSSNEDIVVPARPRYYLTTREKEVIKDIVIKYFGFFVKGQIIRQLGKGIKIKL